jgi:hypothetical protein
VAKERCSRRT